MAMHGGCWHAERNAGASRTTQRMHAPLLHRGSAAGRPSGINAPPRPAPFLPFAGSIGCQIAPGGFVTGLTATATGQTGGTAAGAVRLDACPPRFFRPSTFTNNSCSLCAPGRETRRTTGATVCLACIAGSTLRNPSDVNCTRCSEGGCRGKLAGCAAEPSTAHAHHTIVLMISLNLQLMVFSSCRHLQGAAKHQRCMRSVPAWPGGQHHRRIDLP